MQRKRSDNRNRPLALLAGGVFIAAVVAATLTLWHRKQAEKPPALPVIAETVPVTIPEQPVIAYDTSGAGAESGDLTEKRKAEFGLDKGVDLIVRAGETLKIGDIVVPMQEILDRIRLQRGDIVENNVTGGTASAIPNNRPASLGQGDAYGIYVVQPADNIWNVHFRFLGEYFQQRGIRLSSAADEPARNGSSSGVGKILKFSETMVHIYNLREKRLDAGLDLIHPLTKIVIFDMGQVFSLLDRIDYSNVNQIQFDGKTLWIPAKQ